MELDIGPRVVELDDESQAALAEHPEAVAFWETLSNTNRKEFVTWIADAKRPETRLARIAKTVELLAAGKKNR